MTKNVLMMLLLAAPAGAQIPGFPRDYDQNNSAPYVDETGRVKIPGAGGDIDANSGTFEPRGVPRPDYQRQERERREEQERSDRERNAPRREEAPSRRDDRDYEPPVPYPERETRAPERSPWPLCGPRIPEVGALERRLSSSWPGFNACRQPELAKAFGMALAPSIPQLLGTKSWFLVFNSSRDDGYATKTYVRCASPGFPDDVCGHFSDKIFAARGAAAASHKKAEDALMARVRFEAAGAVQEMEMDDEGTIIQLETRVLGGSLIQHVTLKEKRGVAVSVGYFLALTP